jgi:hypothetical protein
VSADAAPPPPAKARRRFNARRPLGWLASLVKLVCWLIALLLVVYIVFTVGHANPGNPWAIFVARWSWQFNLGLGNLFAYGAPWMTVLINYGMAAIIWLIIGAVLSRLIRRI